MTSLTEPIVRLAQRLAQTVASGFMGGSGMPAARLRADSIALHRARLEVGGVVASGAGMYRLPVQRVDSLTVARRHFAAAVARRGQQQPQQQQAADRSSMASQPPAAPCGGPAQASAAVATGRHVRWAADVQQL